jgi:CelD/BcsL family acetyltransferase involved in cellulose biosynthesis
VLEEIPEDPDLRRAWNELALRMEPPEVFYTYEWAIAVQRAYREYLAPLVFLAYENEALVGLVAFARQKTRMREIAFLTANTADYCDFLSAPGRRQEFAEAVLSELKNRKIEKIVLANLPADSSSVAAISHAASKLQYYRHLRSAYLCSRVVLGSGEQRASLKLSTGAKKRLRRNLRALEKQGPLCVRHDQDWEQIEPILQAFNRAHVARFLATGRISNLTRAERRTFLYQLARQLSRSGWVAVSRLLVGDVSVAWNYGFQFAGSWFWYQPTVNISGNYSDLSPGYCLLAKIVELACDRPEFALVDLGLGAEDYKERFATASRETLYCVLNRSFFHHLRVVMRNRAATVAKAAPRIETWIRGMISSIAKLRAHGRDQGLGGLFTWAARRSWRSLCAFDEVLFFEWPAGYQHHKRSTALLPLEPDLLGAAGIRYADDPVTMAYLMRSAQRFRSGQAQGFAVPSAEGIPVHFCWVRNFEGFEMAELKRTLRAPGKEAMLIFDCFTPASARGHGLFADAIAALADELRSQGKVPWIFGAATNRASLRGIEKSGFAYKFSLGRKKMFFVKKIKDSIPSPSSENITTSLPSA